ncbi:fos-related antigen 1 isoform X1 [Silurus asotus]|uniref:Fos-related antigen 1 isoform X1 n=1 Tax=Silurus asotus TaxID=30991 RepID=A0AAD5B847_SILAS|nr:fos-related antigen 1 isoform X1 [Silurus asotus]
MYRNYGNFSRGTDQNFPDNSSASGSSSASGTQATSSGSTQHPEPKYSVAGSSHFVPTLNAVTSSQDLQWLVQPSVFPMPGPSKPPPRHPYPLPPRHAYVNPQPTQSHLLRPGVIRTVTGSGSSTRRRNDDHLSSEELERRRIRRERNKLAAAKCRTRRRELTDSLQNETDELEDKKSHLQKEIAALQKEKEKLEIVLEAHRPICKVQDSDSDSDSNPVLPSLGGIKIEPKDLELPGPSRKCQVPPKQEKPKPKITIPPQPSASSGSMYQESDSLHTPVLISTPSFASSLMFTYPTSSLDTIATTSQTQSLSAHSTTQHGMSQTSRNPEPCGIAHRRSSSSGDQSDQSLNSPTILTI